ncbi:MAG TPA: hydrolase [Phycisphaerae bacterium]|nr:hydrolase [Phycisphaerae bacterium]
MLDAKRTALVLIDVQEKLAGVMHEKERMFDNLQRLIRGVRVLEVPILWCEQNPAGLGGTITQLVEHLDGLKPIAKMSFDCCACKEFARQLDQISPKHVLLAGIEAHVCVYQTAARMVGAGYDVQIVADAVSSRTPENKSLALGRSTAMGVTITSTEMALFELLRDAENPMFREILKIVK